MPDSGRRSAAAREAVPPLLAKRATASSALHTDSRDTRSISGPATGRASSGMSRLSESVSSDTSTASPTCRYVQYEFKRHRNPRSLPSISDMRVATLRLVARRSEWRVNDTSCSVSYTTVSSAVRFTFMYTRRSSPLRDITRASRMSSAGGGRPGVDSASTSRRTVIAGIVMAPRHSWTMPPGTAIRRPCSTDPFVKAAPASARSAASTLDTCRAHARRVSARG